MAYQRYWRNARSSISADYFRRQAGRLRAHDGALRSAADDGETVSCKGPRIARTGTDETTDWDGVADSPRHDTERSAFFNQHTPEARYAPGFRGVLTEETATLPERTVR